MSRMAFMNARLLVIVTLGVACRDVTKPQEQLAPFILPAAVQRLAYVIDLPTSLAEQSEGVAAAWSGSAAGHFSSLVGADAIEIEIREIQRSVLGADRPGKVRVRMRLRIRNSLRATVLNAPTLPPPPGGEPGLYLFVVKSVAIDAPGGVTTVRNAVDVFAPSHGIVTASDDWDGASYDYLSGGFQNCPTRAATCARFERFSAPLLPNAYSEWRTVGFEIEPTVHGIRMLVVLGADLTNASP